VATLREIAKAAGVSIRTVSRHLIKKGRKDYVGAATRRDIETAIAKLGYQPNLAARALRAARSHFVSVLTFTTDELRMAQVAALQQDLRREDYLVSLTFEQPFASAERIVETLHDLIGQKPAGIAVLGAEPLTMQHAIPALIPTLVRSKIPYVLLDPKGMDKSISRFDSIRINRGRGVQDAVHYLAKRGAKRIAYLGTQEERSRLDGYDKAMKKLGRKPLFVDYPGEELEGLRETARRFAMQKKRPDAVLAHSDFIAMAFLAGLHDAEVKVPDDVALIGFDNRFASDYCCWPRLTTIAQPVSLVGEAGAHVLLRKIQGFSRPPGGWSMTFPTQLILRETA